MATKRVWAWTGRLAALLAAVIIPACGQTGSPGGANPNGILWNSQGTPGGGGAAGNPATQMWVDPNLGAPATIGINNIVVSTDDATYDTYGTNGGIGVNATQVIHYVTSNQAPLSTDTGSPAITSRENTLQGSINGYRQQQLGNVGAGGGGGIGGGVAVGNTTGIILAGHFKATKSARAHCKYYGAGYAGTTAVFVAGPNLEGDDMQTTDLTNPSQNGFRVPTPAGSLGNAYGIGSLETDPTNYKNPDGDQGRLGKIGVVAYVPTFATADFCIAGIGYSEAASVMSQLLRTAPGAIAAMGPTNFGVGHWRNGSQAYYWDIIYLLNPTPAN